MVLLRVWCEGENPFRGRRAAWLSSCSRNAHDKNVLVRRAQSRINQAVLLDGNERAWKDYFNWKGVCSQTVLLARRGPVMKRRSLIRDRIGLCTDEIQRRTSKKSFGLRSQSWQDIARVLSNLARRLASYTEP
jgi:hypothetical protein